MQKVIVKTTPHTTPTPARHMPCRTCESAHSFCHHVSYGTCGSETALCPHMACGSFHFVSSIRIFRVFLKGLGLLVMTPKWSLAAIPKTEKKYDETVISVFGRVFVREPSQRMPGKGFSDNCTSKKVSLSGPNACQRSFGVWGVHKCTVVISDGKNRGQALAQPEDSSL